MSNLPDSVHPHVAEQLLSKSWGELEIMEHADHLLFPEVIHKMKKDGSFETIDVRVRVPREPDLRKARVKARNIAKAEGLDPRADSDLVDNLEIICILSEAIRNTTHPHEPYIPDPIVLEKKYDRASLLSLWDRLEKLSSTLNPRPDTMSEPEMLAVVAAIAKDRSISPLAVYGLDAQASCIISMVDRLASLTESKSSLEQSEHSTQEC